MACVGCPTGRQHAQALSPAHATSDLMRGVSRRETRAPLACVRCGRNGTTAGTRLLGRFRLVRGKTLCVSCYNREREFLHGKNAKGGTPVKWSGLREAHVEIDLHGKRQRHDIGLRSGRQEIERFVARRWPEATIARVWLNAELPASVPAHHPIATARSTARFAVTPEMTR